MHKTQEEFVIFLHQVKTKSVLTDSLSNKLISGKIAHVELQLYHFNNSYTSLTFKFSCTAYIFTYLSVFMFTFV